MTSLLDNSNPLLIDYFTAYIFLASLIVGFWLLILKRKLILSYFKLIPLWLITFNFGFLFYKLFFLEHYFTRNFFVWIPQMIKGAGLEALFTQRSPVYFFIANLLSKIGIGVGYESLVWFNTILCFFSIFFVYLIVLILFKDKVAAGFASLLWAFCPPIFIWGMTPEYAIPALFFFLQAIFFGCIYLKEKDRFSLGLASCSIILATGCRPEYIIFAFLFLLFLGLMGKNIIKKTYFMGMGLVLLPKFIASFLIFFNTARVDFNVHGRAYGGENFFDFAKNTFGGHWNFFLNNLNGNLGVFFNFYTLIGVFSILGIIGLIFYLKKANYRKLVLFLVGYIFFISFFYSFFHHNGLRATLYLLPIIFPMVILASLGLKKIHSLCPKITWILVICAGIYLILFFGLPVTKNLNFEFSHQVYYSTSLQNMFHRDDYIGREYQKYKSLACNDRRHFLTKNKFLASIYENPFSSKKREEKTSLDINLNKKNLFISNGHFCFLYTLPLKIEIHLIFEDNKGNLFQLAEMADPNTTIYVSQGGINFVKKTIDFAHFVDAKEFENTILKLFILKEKLISYYEGEHHIFLYKMSPREKK